MIVLFIIFYFMRVYIPVFILSIIFLYFTSMYIIWTFMFEIKHHYVNTLKCITI